MTRRASSPELVGPEGEKKCRETAQVAREARKEGGRVKGLTEVTEKEGREEG